VTPVVRLDATARIVLALLRRRLPAQVADDVIGDLIEHYGRRRRWKRTWLAVEAVRLRWGFASLHAVEPPARRRRLTVDLWIRDARHAARSVFRSRAFAGIALTSLSLGIGLATAIFSIVDGVLLRPLPYDDADRIVRIREVTAGRLPQGDEVPRPLVRVWQEHSQTVAAFAPYALTEVRLLADSETFAGVRVDVGPRFFDVLRVRPLHGRLLGPADALRTADSVAVLTHGFWRRAYAGDPGVIGRRVLIDDAPAEIVGVLPEEFTYPSAEVALLTPGRNMLPETEPGRAQAFLLPQLELLARLRPGADPDDAAREAVALSARLAASSAGASAPAVAAFEVRRLRDDLVRHLRPALIVLFAAVGCLLAIVCVNLANLLLARGTTRQREMAVRAALGATRWEMTRPLVFEGLILAFTGAALGLGLAAVLVASMPLTASIDPMLASRVQVDARVLTFTFGISALIGVVVGALPAWLAPEGVVRAAVSSSHVHVLPGAAVRAEHLRGALVVVQVALAIVLAVAATLLSRSLATLLSVDLGFEPDRAVVAQIRLPPTGGTAFGWRDRFYEELTARLRTERAVQAAGFTSTLPLRESFARSAVPIAEIVPADPSSPPRAHREVVTPGYFEAIGLPILAGRGFLAGDVAEGERVAIVNEAFVKAFFGGRAPLDQRLMQFGMWHRVVGVARSKRHAGLRSEARPEFYVPLAQAPPDVATASSAGIAIRAAGSAHDVLPLLRSALRRLQPHAAIVEEAILEERLWATTAAPRFYATIMNAFAILALVTALIGLFGVLSFIVERRRVEIGVRRALGATGRDISELVVRKGLMLVLIAIPIGLAGAAAAVGLLRSLLFGIEPADPATFAIVLIAVPIVALAACAWPARRAASIEPLDALREE
jgi:predicted permease